MSETKPHLVEAEIIDENGNAIAPTGPAARREQIREKIHIYRQAGTWTGFVALAFSAVMMFVLAVISVCIIIPLLLIGRIIGLSAQKLHR